MSPFLNFDPMDFYRKSANEIKEDNDKHPFAPNKLKFYELLKKVEPIPYKDKYTKNNIYKALCDYMDSEMKNNDDFVSMKQAVVDFFKWIKEKQDNGKNIVLVDFYGKSTDRRTFIDKTNLMYKYNGKTETETKTKTKVADDDIVVKSMKNTLIEDFFGTSKKNEQEPFVQQILKMKKNIQFLDVGNILKKKKLEEIHSQCCGSNNINAHHALTDAYLLYDIFKICFDKIRRKDTHIQKYVYKTYEEFDEEFKNDTSPSDNDDNDSDFTPSSMKRKYVYKTDEEFDKEFKEDNDKPPFDSDDSNDSDYTPSSKNDKSNNNKKDKNSNVLNNLITELKKDIYKDADFIFYDTEFCYTPPRRSTNEYVKMSKEFSLLLEIGAITLSNGDCFFKRINPIPKTKDNDTYKYLSLYTTFDKTMDNWYKLLHEKLIKNKSDDESQGTQASQGTQETQVYPLNTPQLGFKMRNLQIHF
mgnify:CR=1 FL=1